MGSERGNDAGSEHGNDPEQAGDDDSPAELTRVWLVERTFSDDEQNVVILVYATADGTRYHRKERALTSFTGEGPTVAVSELVGPGKLGDVEDPDTRERYAREASRMAATRGPDGVI